MNKKKEIFETKRILGVRSLDSRYHFEKSVVFGLLAVALFILTGALSGDALIGIFFVSATIYYFRFASNQKLESCSSIKFNCSISRIFEVVTTGGYDLTKWSSDIYIFKTRHFLFKNRQIAVRDCKEFCEVSGSLWELELLRGILVEQFNCSTDNHSD